MYNVDSVGTGEKFFGIREQNGIVCE